MAQVIDNMREISTNRESTGLMLFLVVSSAAALAGANLWQSLLLGVVVLALMVGIIISQLVIENVRKYRGAQADLLRRIEGVERVALRPNTDTTLSALKRFVELNKRYSKQISQKSWPQTVFDDASQFPESIFLGGSLAQIDDDNTPLSHYPSETVVHQALKDIENSFIMPVQIGNQTYWRLLRFDPYTQEFQFGEIAK